MKDIFDIDNIESVIRQVLREHKAIDLRQHNIPCYDIPPSFKTKSITIKDKKNYDDEIKKEIKKVVKEADDFGYNRKKIGTAIHEAVRNAFQHGNKYDSDKKIVVAYAMNPESLEISVIDEGGVLNPEFVSFILKFKNPELSKKFVPFYEFTGQEQPPENFGVGTYLMYSYVDNINYFKSINNGLVVNLHKLKGYDPNLIEKRKNDK